MARYWRISGIQTPSNTLDVQALALSDGSTDYAAPLLSGALGAGFVIDWDLGADLPVDRLKLTAGAQADWPTSLLLLQSVDGQSWAAPTQVATITYPGAGIAATVVPGGSGTTPPAIATPLDTPAIVFRDPGHQDGTLHLRAPDPSAIDMIDGGSHKVVGTVAEKASPTNLPLVRRVMLIDEQSHRVVRETWSDAAGNYSFDSVNANTTYTVLAYDHTETYRAVVADRVLPEAMP